MKDIQKFPDDLPETMEINTEAAVAGAAFMGMVGQYFWGKKGAVVCSMIGGVVGALLVEDLDEDGKKSS